MKINWLEISKIRGGKGTHEVSLTAKAYDGYREMGLLVSNATKSKKIEVAQVQGDMFYFQTNGTSYFSWKRKWSSNNLEYSFDTLTWNTLEPSTRITFTGKVYLRGNNVKLGDYTVTSVFQLGGDDVSVGGNIQYLLDKSGSARISESCFDSLFSGQTALVDAKDLIMPSVMADSACHSMFHNCSRLVNGPNLPAIVLAPYCYADMFSSCEALTEIPKIDAEIMADSCCEYMFPGCTGLTGDIGVLRARELANNCYRRMFYICENITSAEIYGDINKNSCCLDMFSGCSKLNSIIVHSNTPLGTSYSSNWMDGVASSGTFYKKADVSHPLQDPSGVPYGWTTIDF